MTFPPGYDHACMLSAENAARHSPCSRRSVGAHLVTHGGFYSMATSNDVAGFFSGQVCDGVCPRTRDGADLSSYTNCISVHAEASILLAAGLGRAQGSTLYVTSFPCWDCAKLIVHSRVATVYAYLEDRDDHRDPERQHDYMTQNGVAVHAIHR